MLKNRCFGNDKNQKILAKYHDNEWCVPSFDDRYLFEMLILEGAQAGLNWEIILKRREEYKKSLFNFDVHKILIQNDEYFEDLIKNSGVIKNRLKILSIKKNAKVFVKIQEKYGSFSKYIWGFVKNKPIINNWQDISQMPAKTKLSETISKDLSKKGMSFVGPVIIYSYMQAIGLVNDHAKDCFILNKSKI